MMMEIIIIMKHDDDERLGGAPQAADSAGLQSSRLGRGDLAPASLGAADFTINHPYLDPRT